MKSNKLLRFLARLGALPLAWGVASAGSDVATVPNVTVPSETQVMPAEPAGGGIPADRMAALHSLLGDAIVPKEMVDLKAAAPKAPILVADNDQVGSPPPPPPP